MGNVFAEITIKNNGDIIRARDGLISDNKVRTLTLTALVDTGATTLIINENMCNKLGLDIEEFRTATVAGGGVIPCRISETVRIYWKDRFTTVHAWVVPGDDDALLGVIPLEDMDLIVDPRRNELIGAHGDKVIGRI